LITNGESGYVRRRIGCRGLEAVRFVQGPDFVGVSAILERNLTAVTPTLSVFVLPAPIVSFIHVLRGGSLPQKPHDEEGMSPDRCLLTNVSPHQFPVDFFRILEYLIQTNMSPSRLRTRVLLLRSPFTQTWTEQRTVQVAGAYPVFTSHL
jgi:hypothetical protein